MSDDLRERVARAIYDRSWMYDRTKPWTLAPDNEKRLCYEMADAALAEIGAVQNQLDEALNQLDSARHSVEVLERRLAAIEPAPSVRGLPDVSLMTMTLSDGRKDHYVRITCEGCSYDVRRYPDHQINRADYEVAELRHVLLGEPEPDLMDERYADKAIEPAPAVSVREAARVLLALTPNPVFDILKPVLLGEFSFQDPCYDEDGEEATRRVTVPWDTTKLIIAAALRAIAEGKDDD